jgi:hypothetical protein
VVQRDSDRFARGGVALCACVAAACSLGYALTNPVFEAPDEPSHVQYVSLIARTGQLANLKDRTQVDARGEGHQHPLYYVVAAGLVRLCTGDGVVTVAPQPNQLFYGVGGTRFVHAAAPFPRRAERVAFYALRCLNALCVGLLVWVVGCLALRCIRSPFALLAPGLIATLPQLQYIGGSVSNDTLATLLGAVALHTTLRARETGRWWLAALACSAAYLTKKSDLVFFVPLLLALWPLGALRGRRLAGFVAGLLPAGLWMLRQWHIYGGIFGGNSEVLSRPDLLTPKTLASPYFTHQFLQLTYQSFFARLGWMQVAIDPWLVCLCSVPFVPGLLGILAARQRSSRTLALVCIAVCVLNLAGLVHYNMSYSQPQGRLLFPTLGALALLAALGWQLLCGTCPPRWRAGLVAGVLLCMLGCDAAVGWAYRDYNARSAARVREAIAAGAIVLPPPGAGNR